MYSLNEQQIDFILNDIKNRGVEMEDLQLNLLDHICCVIEHEFTPQKNASENDDGEVKQFYQKIIPRFFKKELKEIEEETVYLLTFKHYYAMKKVMITSGAVAAFAFIIGSLFKIMHWPGAAVMLFSAILIFCFIFLPLMFTLKVKENIPTRNKLIVGVGTIFGITISMATMFKIMHWPYANMLWLVSLGMLFLLFLPIYFFSGMRNAETKVNTIISSVMILVAGGLLFSLTSLKPSKKLEQIKIQAYLNNEILLEKVSNITIDTLQNEKSKLVTEINSDCNKLKKLVLMDEIGIDHIPIDFEKKEITMIESTLSKDVLYGKGGELINSLIDKIELYNSTAQDKIPTTNTLFENKGEYNSYYTNYFVLNNINQIQMALAIN